jgi:hypothetical protein
VGINGSRDVDPAARVCHGHNIDSSRYLVFEIVAFVRCTLCAVDFASAYPSLSTPVDHPFPVLTRERPMTMTSINSDATMPDHLIPEAVKPVLPERRKRPARAPQHAVSKTYVAAWVIMGIASGSYIATAAIDPGLLAGLTGNTAIPATDMAGTQGLIRQSIANMQSLQKTVSGLAGDVQQLKTTTQLQLTRQAEVDNRVSHIETRLSGIAAAAPVAPHLPNIIRGATPASVETLPAQSAAQSAAMTIANQMAEPASTEAQRQSTDAKNQGRLGALPVVQTVPTPQASAAPASELRASRQALHDPVAIQLQPSAIETGSVARKLPTPQVAQAPAAIAKPIAPTKSGTPTAVQIAAGPSVDALRLNWMLLSDRHSNVLKALEPRYVADPSGIYRLVAGPFASPAEAQRACADLKARGANCQTTDFNGEAL